MVDRLNRIEGDVSYKRTESAELLVLYLETLIEAADRDSFGILTDKTKKDAYIADCTRAYVEAYREYINEIRK